MQRCLFDHPPVKYPDIESLISFPGGKYLTRVNFQRIKCSLCDSTGRRLLEASVWFPLGFVTFGDFGLCSFIVINHSCEYSQKLSSVSPLCKSLHLEVVFRTPATVYLMFPYDHIQAVHFWWNTTEMIPSLSGDHVRRRIRGPSHHH